MAKYLDPAGAAEVGNLTERRVYEEIAGHADADKWCVLHSQNLADHIRQVRGEIDFVCAIPGLGVLCVEVKGFDSLERREGESFWRFNDGTSFKGPITQASNNALSVRDAAREVEPEFAVVPLAHAVLLPNLRLNLPGHGCPEWKDWEVLDSAAIKEHGGIVPALRWSMRKSLEFFLRKRDLHWLRPPDEAGCDTIAGWLRPAVSSRADRTFHIGAVDSEVARATEQQQMVLDLVRLNPRVLMEGPAGSGKTLLALEHAATHALRGGRVLLLCFNRLLMHWLKARVEGMLPPEAAARVTVTTLHALMRQAAGLDLANAPQVHDPAFWSAELPRIARERLAGDPAAAAALRHDVLVLDEAQDVLWNDAFVEFLDAVLAKGLAAGHFLMCGDFACQSLHHFTQAQGVKLIGRTGATRLRLDWNCRNTRSVGGFACRVMGRPTLYRRYRRDSGPPPGGAVRVCCYHDATEQLEMLERLLEQLAPGGRPAGGERIAVLTARNTRSGAAAGLAASSGLWAERLRVLKQTEPFTPQAERDLRAFLGGRWDFIAHSSAFSFKGLEAHTVIVTDVHPDAFDAEQPSRGLYRDPATLLFEAATRSLDRLHILVHDSLHKQVGAWAGDPA